jgi:hypothetical protein
MLLSAPIRLFEGFVALGAVALAAGCLTPSPSQAPPLAANSRLNPPPPGYPPSIVAAVVRDHATEVQTCFDRALEHESRLHGRLVLHWAIGAGGRSTGMQVRENPSSDQRLSACITQAIAGWQFPPAAGGTAGVSYTFSFE